MNGDLARFDSNLNKFQNASQLFELANTAGMLASLLGRDLQGPVTKALVAEELLLARPAP